MSKKVCCACCKEFDYGITKGGQELAGRTSYKYVCQECCDKLGIKKGIGGAFKVSTMNAEKFIRKLYEVAPSPELSKQLEIVSKAIKDEKAELRAEFKKEIETATKHAGCKQKEETKYTCTQCGHVYFVGDFDQLKNINNILNCSVYTVNKLRNFQQCPRCGSSQTRHEKVTFWVDKQGNVVE